MIMMTQAYGLVGFGFVLSVVMAGQAPPLDQRSS
jgi:hypothetical protein